MPTQPLGWFRKAVAKAEDLKGLRVRTDAASGEVYAAFGAAPNFLSEAEILAAVKGGTLDAVELNNASSDRALGLPDLFEVCMLQSYHQNAEQLEVLFNRAKYDALPARVKAIIANAVEAASADMSWKAIDRYSRDYVEMRQRERLRFFKTPDAILQRQLTAYDAAADKQNRENPLHAEIAASQQRFAERAVRWDLDTNVQRDIAYRHYFSKPRPGKAPAKKA
jgi:TRAP-type mannitol/chloroaromatic compound transport system substrate-binding protein